ncbi:RidA family protein [Kordiimonas pumila]|uniref:RidA family protein n=1 Tax=Kordiimonas pumila TaxID=2161677 RepID=A0ABV7DA63_9PROT|nr:RidA family protein [Kordiimonas pumila]
MSKHEMVTERLYIGASPLVKKAAPGFKISRAVRVGDWCITNGQMDIGENARVLNTDDIISQTVSCMRSIYELMARTGFCLSELAQLQVFYHADFIEDEAAFRGMILEEFPECGEALMMITRVPSFATVGHVVEIDAMAIKGPQTCVANEKGVVTGVRRGDWVLASSRVNGDSKDICAGLRTILGELGAGLNDVCRLYVYYPADLTAAEHSDIERALAAAFADMPPAYHAALLPKTSKSDFAVELEVIANSGFGFKKIRLGRATAPSADIDWPFAETLRCGDVIFTSGQFSVDETGAVLHAENIVAQSREVMRRLGKALNKAGADFSDLAKIKTYFEGEADLDNWLDNLNARMESLSDPGPASTGIEGLPPVIEGTLLSVDGIVILDSADND